MTQRWTLGEMQRTVLGHQWCPAQAQRTLTRTNSSPSTTPSMVTSLCIPSSRLSSIPLSLTGFEASDSSGPHTTCTLGVSTPGGTTVSEHRSWHRNFWMLLRRRSQAHLLKEIACVLLSERYATTLVMVLLATCSRSSSASSALGRPGHTRPHQLKSSRGLWTSR